MKTRQTLKPRGVRLSDDQWTFLEAMAKDENRRNKGAGATPSDAVRHAVDELMKSKEAV